MTMDHLDEAATEMFAIRIMHKLSELPGDSPQWSEELTDNLCQLCDMIRDPSVAECLMKFHFISLVETLMKCEYLHEEVPRLMELLVCCLNNLCCYEDVYSSLVPNEKLVLPLISLFDKSDDVDFLKEILRYLITVTSNVPREKSLNNCWRDNPDETFGCTSTLKYSESRIGVSNNIDSQSGSAVSIDQPLNIDDSHTSTSESETLTKRHYEEVFVENILSNFLEGQDSLEKLLFIFRSCTNDELIQKGIEFLAYICMIPSVGDTIFSHYLPAPDVLESLSEALSQLESSDSLTVGSSGYITTIVASFTHDVSGRKCLMTNVPMVCAAVCRLLTFHYGAVIQAVIKILTSYMVDGSLLCMEVLNKIVWVYKEVTKPTEEGKSWDHWTHLEGDDNVTPDDVIAGWIKDYFRSVILWNEKQALQTSDLDETLSSITSILSDANDL